MADFHDCLSVITNFFAITNANVNNSFVTATLLKWKQG